MKNVRMILVLVLLSFGANYVLASSTWRNPTAEPPGGNADAPINVSAEGQTKEGALSILNAFDSNTLAVFGDAFFGTTVQIAGGSPGLNKVLTSDAEGVASWVV